ncbi:hypothetical protein, partial [Pantoea sp. M_9]|uniref:hypothetical protein n=1 Tax=Pantoea sp. M_9 TaxID=2608041 RepID=UPI001CC1F10B
MRTRCTSSLQIIQRYIEPQHAHQNGRHKWRPYVVGGAFMRTRCASALQIIQRHIEPQHAHQ